MFSARMSAQQKARWRWRVSQWPQQSNPHYEAELHQQIHLESNVLFLRAFAIEAGKQFAMPGKIASHCRPAMIPADVGALHRDPRTHLLQRGQELLVLFGRADGHAK